jgi:asparagine synthase (glutamine-hydrolysing)
MSAIAGLCRTDGEPVHRGEVERMASALAHRGPDGNAVWSDGPAGLAHAALWTTPEARRERQPVVGATRSIIVADVRLDNRGDLITALDLAGPGAGDIGDAELILHAYERWGEACAPRLVGDFAFAIWDPRHRRLFCARDHVGVKPFYYSQASAVFLFASEIKALLTSPLVPYRLNPLRVADHLLGLFDDRAITFYRDISRLPAGHTLTVSHAGTHIQPYWALDAVRELRLGSDDAYAAAFRECFTEAVRCRLRSSHRVGSLLSGGLDTSSIVGVARRIRGVVDAGTLDTFTAIFPGLAGADLRRIDERVFVDAIVGQGGLDPHYVRGDLLSPLTEIDRALWHLDEAFTAPNLYLHWALYAAAQERGVRSLLDGIDGDTVVSHGFERLADLVRAGKVMTLGRELRALSRRYRVGASGLLWQFGIQPLLPAAVQAAGRRLRGVSPAPSLADSVIKAEFGRRVGIAERAGASERQQRRPARSAREAHQRGLASGLIPYVLEMADKAASAFALEPRYPFLDRRLIELCVALPPEQKLRGGWTRAVVRQAMDGLLPEEVRWRAGKADLSPNFMRQLLDRDREIVADVIVRNPDVLEDYVDISALRRVYDRYTAGSMSDADALTIHRTVVLGLWLQRAKVAP